MRHTPSLILELSMPYAQSRGLGSNSDRIWCSGIKIWGGRGRWAARVPPAETAGPNRWAMSGMDPPIPLKKEADGQLLRVPM
jgi:hypothetical protein